MKKQLLFTLALTSTFATSWSAQEYTITCKDNQTITLPKETVKQFGYFNGMLAAYGDDQSTILPASALASKPTLETAKLLIAQDTPAAFVIALSAFQNLSFAQLVQQYNELDALELLPVKDFVANVKDPVITINRLEEIRNYIVNLLHSKNIQEQFINNDSAAHEGVNLIDPMRTVKCTPLQNQFVKTLPQLKFAEHIEEIYHQEDPNFLQFSSSGKYFIAADKNTANIFDVTTLIHKITISNPSPVTNIRFSPNEQFLVITHQGGTIKIVNLTNFTNTVLNDIYINKDNPNLFFIPNSNNIAFIAHDSTVKIINLENPQTIIHSFEDDNIPASAITISPCGKFLAISFNNANVKLINLNNHNAPAHIIPVQPHFKLYVAFSPDGKFLAISCGAFPIKIIDLDNLTEEPFLIDAGHLPVLNFKFSSDGKILAINHIFSRRNSDLSIVDMTNFATITIAIGDNIQDYFFSPDNKSLFLQTAANYVNRIDLLNPHQPEIYALFRYDTGICKFSPDSQFAIAKKDNCNSISIFNMYTKKINVMSLPPEMTITSPFVFSNDSKFFAYGHSILTAHTTTIMQLTPQIAFKSYGRIYTNSITQVTFDPTTHFIAELEKDTKMVGISSLYSRVKYLPLQKYPQVPFSQIYLLSILSNVDNFSKLSTPWIREQLVSLPMALKLQVNPDIQEAMLQEQKKNLAKPAPGLYDALFGHTIECAITRAEIKPTDLQPIDSALANQSLVPALPQENRHQTPRELALSATESRRLAQLNLNK